MHRFFVKVFASDARTLRGLQKHDLDLFHSTARRTEDNRASIEGLLTLKEIEQLVLDGYQVLVEEEASKRAHGQREIMTFEEWVLEKEQERKQ